MIITGLVGALIPSSYKWGLFTFGMVALVYVRIRHCNPQKHTDELDLVGLAWSRKVQCSKPRWQLLPSLHRFGFDPLCPLASLPDCLGYLRRW
jgi:hypothetical protein